MWWKHFVCGSGPQPGNFPKIYLNYSIVRAETTKSWNKLAVHLALAQIRDAENCSVRLKRILSQLFVTKKKYRNKRSALICFQLEIFFFSCNYVKLHSYLVWKYQNADFKDVIFDITEDLIIIRCISSIVNGNNGPLEYSMWFSCSAFKINCCIICTVYKY